MLDARTATGRCEGPVACRSGEQVASSDAESNVVPGLEERVKAAAGWPDSI